MNSAHQSCFHVVLWDFADILPVVTDQSRVDLDVTVDRLAERIIRTNFPRCSLGIHEEVRGWGNFHFKFRQGVLGNAEDRRLQDRV